MSEVIINKIIKTVEDAISSFNRGIPGIQQQIYDDVILLVKDLDISPDGTIKNNVRNLKTIGKIRSKIEQIVLSPEYIKDVERFTEAFTEIGKLHNRYFRSIEATFTPTALLDEISKQSIAWTIESLTEAGIGANVTTGIEDILRRNITTGGSYTQMTAQLRSAILSDKSGDGLLERYSKQITVDSIMQYNRTYSQAISDDLGLNWFMYVGSNISTTREFCLEMTKKKYVHRSELPDIAKGDIDGNQVPINPKTKTWAGGIPGTNQINILTNAGGYNCQHQFQPVLSAAVPKEIRMRFE